jgi:hypothetical protein
MIYPMKIGLDFDGVIANSAKLKAKVARELFHIDVPDNEFGRHIVVEERKLLTLEEYRLVQRKVYNETDDISFLEPNKDALEYIEKLQADEHVLSVITSREGGALNFAKRWLAHYNLNIPIEGVGVGRDKTPVAGGLQAFVDDTLSKLAPLAGTVEYLFIFSWPYNLHQNEAGIAIRVHSWSELYEEISKVSERA